MTIETPTDRSACPADQNASQEAQQACARILAENGSAAPGSPRPTDARTTPTALDVRAAHLYPHHGAVATSRPTATTEAHPKSQPGVRSVSTNPTADAQHPAPERPDSKPNPLSWETVDIQREVLRINANSLPPKDAATLVREMAQFERRAKARHMPDSEIYKTYESVTQLLDASSGSLGWPDRRTLALQVMHQAAHPGEVRQGRNYTCEMASLEFVLYSKTPSVAADVVAQSATHGFYRDKQGTIIPADIEATRESNHYRPGRGDRSYASQLFQSMAINAGYAAMGEPFVYRESHDRNGGGVVIDTRTGQRSHYNNSDDAYATNAYYAMTGKRDLTIVDSGRGDPLLPNILTANTPAQFNAIMRKLKNENQFPVIVGVDTQNQPFWNDQWGGDHDPHKPYERMAGHDIAVTDFHDHAPPTVSIHNNWLPENDHRAMSAHELFLATRPARANLPELEREFEASQRTGKPNYLQAIDILRIKAGFGLIKEAELRSELLKDLTALVNQQGASVASQSGLQSDWEEISNQITAHGGTNPVIGDPVLWKKIFQFMESIPTRKH